MFFFAAFWGKKKVENRLGFVADFCFVCRKITAFEICRIGVASHVYFVAVEEGGFVENSQQCLSCRTTFRSNLTRFCRLADIADPSVDRLAHSTFPSVYLDFADRLALEERIASDPHAFDAGFRKKLLMEPFQLASPYYENRRTDAGLRILTTALRPLDPTEDEVRECLSHYRRLKAAIGGLLNTATVMKKLKRNPALDYEY